MADKTMRLQKMLAECGVASRRKAEELIAAGKVRVNGHPAQIGQSVDPLRDEVTVGGKRVKRQENLRYIMLHKPRGYVTTMTDELGRRCVAQLVQDVRERVYPVGRLDRNSEGLLLLTNDGSFANTMMHPRSHVPKVYRVTVRGVMTQEQMDRFAAGIELEGRMTAPCEIIPILKEEERMVVEVVLYEGRNRQIRYMMEALGLTPIRLKRKAIGPVQLGMLPQGQWRDLTEQEVKALLRSASQKGREQD